ncbi:MAG: M20/M25/M40 family metallo-hydrolase [Eubacterium sp.]|nr:M20/M25/M40 family metallo-hydrolase [Eubacterium sp.]
MRLDCFDEVKRITSEMVAIPSINKEPGGESAVARYVGDYYMSLPYFQAHPDQVMVFQTKNDFVERHSTIAYVKGTKGNSNKTIILLGHIDTVGVDDFAQYRDYAFDTEHLPEVLKEHFDLPQHVIDDIDSGEFMFGRGALDMKSGVAGHMVIMKYFSEHPEELDGNLVQFAECDEEDNSKGVITGLDVLVDLKKKEGFEYIACINADYSTDYAPGDENRYIYYGSIGKLLPCFVAFGKEAHVGAAFSAFDPNLLIAEVTRNMSLNTDLCDIAQGEVAIPPISLKQMDTKGPYTVQTALVAFSYYNYFTHGLNPAQVLEKCKAIGVKSMDSVIEYLNTQWKRFCEISNVPCQPLPWKTRVYTWEEFYNELAEKHGKPFEDAIQAYKEKLQADDPTLDLRLYSLKVAEEAWKWHEDKSPALVIFFGSVYSARIEMTRKTEKECELLDAVEAAVEVVRPEAERQIKTRMFYPYISDSSFMAVCDELSSVDTLGANMPSWKTKYFHDVNKILEINVPVVNIGTFGRDGHMLTERVDMKQTFRNVPNITFEAVSRLLK